MGEPSLANCPTDGDQLSIIIGAAFTGIVNSLVKDMLMPPIGWIMGGIDFSNYFISLSGGRFDSITAAEAAGAATVNYGRFINTVINFLIVAATLFLIVRQVNRLHFLQSAQKSPPRQEILLEEIRDALRARDTPAPPDRPA